MQSVIASGEKDIALDTGFAQNLKLRFDQMYYANLI